MQELTIYCPCCGHRFNVPIAGALDPSVEASADQQTLITEASRLGIELGALEGGEKIG